MTELRMYVAVAGVAMLSLGAWFWRRATARGIAERWLAQHRYRVHQLRTVFWSGSPHFRATPFRNNDWAFDFKADVDDMRLGGTGTVRLRVWTDWLGMIDREPEISWDRMPTEADNGARAPETQWADAQIALLRRAASGESTFRPAGSNAAARSLFDEEVEHMLALNRRGLVTCSTPIAELRSGAQYAALTNVALTDEGRRVLEQADATEAARVHLHRNSERLTMLDAIRSLFSSKPAADAGTAANAPDVDPVHLAACSLLLEVAHADGVFSPEERAHLEQVLERHFALPAESGQRLIELAEKERRGSIDHFQFTRVLNERYDVGQKMVLAEVMWGLVLADGQIAEHEHYLTRKIANLLELEPGYLSAAKARAAGKS